MNTTGKIVLSGLAVLAIVALANKSKATPPSADASKSNLSLMGHYCCPDGYNLQGTLCKDGYGHTVPRQTCISSRNAKLRKDPNAFILNYAH